MPRAWSTITIFLLLSMQVLPATAAQAEEPIDVYTILGNQFQMTEAVYGANAHVTIEFAEISARVVCLGGGKPDFLYPVSDIYVVRSPPNGGQTLSDVSGSKNTAIGISGGFIVDELIAVTKPSGTLPAGTYSVVVDNCQNGRYDQLDDYVVADAFTVVVPVNAPAAPSIAIMKSKAGALGDAWTQKALGDKLILDMLSLLEKLQGATQPGAVIVQFAKDKLQKEALKILAQEAGIPHEKKVRDYIKTGAIDIEKALGAHYTAIAADPPDYSYEELAALVVAPVPDEEDGDPLFDAQLALAREAAVEAALTSALLQTYERYQGAELDDRGQAALAQARLGASYADLLAAQSARTRDAALALRTAFATDARDLDALFAGYAAARASLLAGSFDAQLIALAEGLGVEGEDFVLRMRNEAAGEGEVPTRAGLVASLDALAAEEGAIAADFTSLAADLRSIAAALVTRDGMDGAGASADAGGPYAGVEGGLVALDAGASSATGGIVSFSWDLDADGVFDDATGSTPDVPAGGAGRRIIGVRAVGADGSIGQSYATLDVADADLPARITASSPAAAQLEVLVGTTVSFSATAADAGDAPVTLRWKRNTTATQATGQSFGWTPIAADIGMHEVFVIADDGSATGGRDVRSWQVAVVLPDADGDAWRANVDCDDADPAVHPRQLDLLNGVDDDCDAATPDGGEVPVLAVEGVRTTEYSGCQHEGEVLCELSLKEGTPLFLRNATVAANATVVVSIAWGDGSKDAFTQAPGPIETLHTYDQEGTYLVRLCAASLSGGRSCVDVTAVVENVAPGVQSPAPTSTGDVVTAILPLPHGDLDSLTGWTLGDLGCGYPGTNPTGWHPSGGHSGGYVALEACGSCNTDPYLERVVRGFIPGATYRLHGYYQGYNYAGLPFHPEVLWVALDGVPQAAAPKLWDGSPPDRWDPFSIRFAATEETHVMRIFAEPGCDDSAVSVDSLELFRDGLAEGISVDFTGEAFDVGPLDVHAMRLYDAAGQLFADGVELADAPGTFRALHRYLDDTNTSIDLCIDDGSNTTCIPVGLNVENVPPAVEAGPDLVVERTASLRGRFHDPGTLDSHVASIDWGDGASQSFQAASHLGAGLVSLEHAYAAPGTYDATLCVLDDDGGEGCDAIGIEVTGPRAPVVFAGADTVALTRASSLGMVFFDNGSAPGHTVEVDWGDGMVESAQPADDLGYAGALTLGHTYATAGAYSVRVTLCDDGGLCDEAETTATVLNFAPVVVATPSPVGEGAVTTLAVAFTDELGVVGHDISVEWGDGAVHAARIASDTGTTGTITLTHAYADDGEYPVRVEVCDVGALCGIATPTALVANLPPRTLPDAITVRENTSASIDPRANDEDIVLDLPLAIVSVTNGSHGRAAFNATSVTYTPGPARYSGPDVFTYVVSDGDGGFATGVVHVTVTPDLAPTAHDENVSAWRYGFVEGNVLENDEDPEDGRPVVRELVQPPRTGRVELSLDGAYRYEPDPATFQGSDRFTYRVCDTMQQCDVATVFIAEATCARGFASLARTIGSGLLSETLDEEVGQRLAALDRDAAMDVHEANCRIVVPAEETADGLLMEVLP